MYRLPLSHLPYFDTHPTRQYISLLQTHRKNIFYNLGFHAPLLHAKSRFGRDNPGVGLGSAWVHTFSSACINVYRPSVIRKFRPGYGTARLVSIPWRGQFLLWQRSCLLNDPALTRTHQGHHHLPGMATLGQVPETTIKISHGRAVSGWFPGPRDLFLQSLHRVILSRLSFSYSTLFWKHS